MQVKIVADSISPVGKRITTMELEYPRFIHAELMTHRVFSRNGQSSRAVPLKKSLDQSPVLPMSFGKNAPGMSSKESLSPSRTILCKVLWVGAAYVVRASSSIMAKIGLHKQWANRPLEWQQNIKVVVTSTEWDNFFSLRLDSNTVQPEMVELAKLMKREMELSFPISLNVGEWHLPYLRTTRSLFDEKLQYHNTERTLSLEDAKKISASCCAQVSYRNLDMSLEKAEKVIKMLTKADDPHLSPFEHQATPMERQPDPEGWSPGITHVDRGYNYWSGNLQGFVQYRQLLDVK